MLSHFSLIQLLATLWPVAYQAPLSMGLSRWEYWSGMSFPSPSCRPPMGSISGTHINHQVLGQPKYPLFPRNMGLSLKSILQANFWSRKSNILRCWSFNLRQVLEPSFLSFPLSCSIHPPPQPVSYSPCVCVCVCVCVCDNRLVLYQKYWPSFFAQTKEQKRLIGRVVILKMSSVFHALESSFATDHSRRNRVLGWRWWQALMPKSERPGFGTSLVFYSSG